MSHKPYAMRHTPYATLALGAGAHAARNLGRRTLGWIRRHT